MQIGRRGVIAGAGALAMGSSRPAGAQGRLAPYLVDLGACTVMPNVAADGIPGSAGATAASS